MRDLRWITQKYTDYAKTIYAIYAETQVLRSFYAALRSQFITHATREAGAAPPLPSVSVTMRNDA